MKTPDCQDCKQPFGATTNSQRCKPCQRAHALRRNAERSRAKRHAARGMRACRQCGIDLAGTNLGRVYCSRSCDLKYQYAKNKEKINVRCRAYYHANRDEQIAKAKVRNRTRLYGLSPEQHAAMQAAQQGRCAICGETPNVLAVDHDHATGAVRALLCQPCNKGIGHLRDDPGLLAKAAQYVYGHRPLVQA